MGGFRPRQEGPSKYPPAAASLMVGKEPNFPGPGTRPHPPSELLPPVEMEIAPLAPGVRIKSVTQREGHTPTRWGLHRCQQPTCEGPGAGPLLPVALAVHDGTPSRGHRHINDSPPPISPFGESWKHP